MFLAKKREIKPSTGLEYNPGLNAEEDDDQMSDSLKELLKQGEHSRVHV